MKNIKNQTTLYEVLCKRKEFNGFLTFDEKNFNLLLEAYMQEEVVAICSYGGYPPLFVRVWSFHLESTRQAEKDATKYVARISVTLC